MLDIRFHAHFTCAIWEHNWYVMMVVVWREHHATLLGFGYAAVMTGAFVARWGSVSGLCSTALAAAAAASRHFTSLALILRAAQRSFRLDGLDTVVFLLFTMMKTMTL